MASAYSLIVEGFSNFFQNLEAAIPENYRAIVSLSLYTVFIFVYAVFIWKFYRFMAERDIIKLNLSEYSFSKYPNLEKTFAVILNLVEYIIILPALVLFWFTIFSIFLIVLSEFQNTYQILLISAAIIASTRITAYLSQELSKDLAKIFPFTVLALFLLDPDFFKLSDLFDRIAQIPEIFTHILVFVVFIFGVELILRGLYSVAQLIGSRVSLGTAD